MSNGLVLRYSLWYTQRNQDVSTKQFKYVPDIDYTNIHNDEELLTECGFTDEEIEKVMDYLESFNFNDSRNDKIMDKYGQPNYRHTN